jgi:hypothetical protein
VASNDENSQHAGGGATSEKVQRTEGEQATEILTENCKHVYIRTSTTLQVAIAAVNPKPVRSKKKVFPSAQPRTKQTWFRTYEKWFMEGDDEAVREMIAICEQGGDESDKNQGDEEDMVTGQGDEGHEDGDDGDEGQMLGPE